jgi:hypothetical protein
MEGRKYRPIELRSALLSNAELHTRVQHHQEKSHGCAFRFDPECYEPSSFACDAQHDSASADKTGQRVLNVLETAEGELGYMKLGQMQSAKFFKNLSQQAAGARVVARAKYDPECVRVSYQSSALEESWLEKIDNIVKLMPAMLSGANIAAGDAANDSGFEKELWCGLIAGGKKRGA